MPDQVDGSRVAVGFRPSGDLHLGNLLSIGYATVIAERYGLTVDLMCCDTDWSAHIHENTYPDENRVMTLFFQRDCPCGQHRNVAVHHMEKIRPFLDGLRDQTGASIDTGFLTDIAGDDYYMDALRTLLDNIDAFDSFYGGGFRRRYRSPVTAVCSSCGHSHAKGSAYAPEHDAVVHTCRVPDCGAGFASTALADRIGVYYLVDPIRDPGRDVAFHVFGGDYRTAEKEQETPKISKVAKTTHLATGETPHYVLGPLIADAHGTPLSKSGGTGATVAAVDDLEQYGTWLAAQIPQWLDDSPRALRQKELKNKR
jgi:lysyl-tRNA synthetase class I